MLLLCEGSVTEMLARPIEGPLSGRIQAPAQITKLGAFLVLTGYASLAFYRFCWCFLGGF